MPRGVRPYEPTGNRRMPARPAVRSVRESDLEQRYRNLATVVDSLHCGLVGRDPDGTIVFVNDRLLGWLGYERQEMLGRHVEELVPPELRSLSREDMQAMERGDLRARLLTIMRRDGTGLPVLTLPQRFYDTKGRFVRNFALVLELSTILTAKNLGVGPNDVRSHLSRIALELECISAATGSSPVAVPLDHPDLQELSSREQEVLVHLMGGHRVPAIAKRLYISPHTVRNHLKGIFRKLGVHSQSDLIDHVRQLGQEARPIGPGSRRIG